MFFRGYEPLQSRYFLKYFLYQLWLVINILLVLRCTVLSKTRKSITLHNVGSGKKPVIILVEKRIITVEAHGNCAAYAKTTIQNVLPGNNSFTIIAYLRFSQ